MSNRRRPDPIWKSLGDCRVTGKSRYETRKASKRAMKRDFPKERLNAYLCKHCDNWHFGHLPDEVRHGVLTRQRVANGIEQERDGR